MKENRYDDKEFFLAYSRMMRSEKGLEGAGEWPELERHLPDFSGKRVLDLGCGYGWHDAYAVQHGAEYVLATDISSRMLERAMEINSNSAIEYRRVAMEDLELPDSSFDIVISSLAFHYISDFPSMEGRFIDGCVLAGHSSSLLSILYSLQRVPRTGAMERMGI